MNKKELVTKIASEAQLTRTQAACALRTIVSEIQASLVKGDRVTISGFGTFVISHRKARVVRNPRDGTAIEIAARVVPRFAPGIDLRAAIRRSAK